MSGDTAEDLSEVMFEDISKDMFIDFAHATEGQKHKN